MFERFTRGARETVIVAQEQARRRGDLWVGTEHLLLALTRQPARLAEMFADAGITYDVVDAAITAHIAATDDADRQALAAIGIDMDRVQETLGAEREPSPLELKIDEARKRLTRNRPPRRRRAPVNALPFTPRAKRALERSLRESLQTKQRIIEPEHIALALVRGDGVARAVLEDGGADLDELAGHLETSALV